MSRARHAHRLLLVVGLLIGLVGSIGGPAGASLIDRDFPSSVDAYATYQGQRRCSGTEQPGVVEFRALLREAYDANDGGILRGCGHGSRSEHKEGRAYDWMLDAGDPEDRAKAEEFLGWLLATDEHGNRHAMARRFGVMYVIWNRRTWSAYRPEAGWQPYGGASPHTDHIHFSFSWDGARRETSFWTAPTVEEIVTAAPGPFQDVTRAHPFLDAIDWAVTAEVASGRPDGRFLPDRPVTRAQIATWLWQAEGRPEAGPTEGFDDVPEDAYYREAVSWLQAEGIATGLAAGRFGPSAQVTRGQVATMLYQLQGAPGTSASHGFRDVSPDDHYDRAVAWLSANDVIRGVTETTFAGGDPVTRAQAVALLYRLR